MTDLAESDAAGSGTTESEKLRGRAATMLQRLGGLCGAQDLAEAKCLVQALRDAREYDLMGQLAEAVSRIDPRDATNRRLYAQCLLDTGRATVAIDVLRPLVRRLPKGHKELDETAGLLGRAYKQIFVDAGDKTDAGAREALRQAVAAYRAPYEQDRQRNTWHGVNLVALLTRARRLGLRVAPDLDPQAIAAELVRTLQDRPAAERDAWFWPTLAEASLALGDWDVVESHLRRFVATDDAKAFQVASTLRQFTAVWGLDEADARGRALVDILRARLMQLRGGEVRLAAANLRHLQAQAAPSREQLEAVLGKQGTQTYQWWKRGLECARSVGAIRRRLGGRIGTGFLVRASSLGLEPADELLVLTNFHVVNEQGDPPGIRPDEAEVVFEAADASRAYEVAQIVWSSPTERHDASLLRLAAPVAGIAPLPIARSLPMLEESASVYVIGHPGGNELAFSFQDNELLDHEGPPGVEQIAGVCRIHYRAPTEQGSSGSPVFNAMLWQVIGLHHKGGKLGMPMLNGKPGMYKHGANEAVSIQSIVKALSQEQPR